MSTALYFAMCGNSEVNKHSLGGWNWDEQPLNLLVAFPFIKHWREREFEAKGGLTMLDSGAYSAWKSGAKIDIDKLCEEARNPDWNEVVALDVIGDQYASAKNALYMKEKGLTVMPVFHYGDDWALLKEYCDAFDRVGLSCRFGEKLDKSFGWLDQCFARAYPKKFHSFGWVARDMLWRFPFFSADTASWHNGVRFGRLSSVPTGRYKKKSECAEGEHAYDLRIEIRHYLRLQSEIQDRWRQELAWSQPSPASQPLAAK